MLKFTFFQQRLPPGNNLHADCVVPGICIQFTFVQISSCNHIRIRGARQNNLKGIDLDLPLGQLIVVTGLSGSGKSSLVFETLHAEGQRRYVETFSPYTRQFLEMMDRPQVDSIENIRPSIAIQQRNSVKTSRSTVGTMTELCDYFKVWFANAATLFDPVSGKAVEDDNPQTSWRKLMKEFRGKEVLVCFEVTRPEKLEWSEVLGGVNAQGFTRVILADKALERLNAERMGELLSKLEASNARTLSVVVDRIKVDKAARNRFIESATNALHFGQGVIQVRSMDGGLLRRFSEGLHSPETGQTFTPAIPNLFSFNSPLGACPKCRGFGRVIEIDYKLVIPDHTLSLAEGAVRPFQGNVYSESLRDLMRAARVHGIRTNVPWFELTEAEQAFVIEGEPEYTENAGEWAHKWYGVRRFFDWLESNTYKMHVRVFLSKYRAYTTCPACGGTRLQPESLNWKWREWRLPDLYQLPITELYDLLNKENIAIGTAGSPQQRQANLALDAILTRLNFLIQVGLEYLTLDRSSRTLSGGEVQRINLTSCLGSSLTDTLFVLDEPSVGLHARDLGRLVGILRKLVDAGNTVVVVEHDETVMRAADWLVEIGPEQGERGGEVVFNGQASEIISNEKSITAKYLSGEQTIETPARRRRVTKNHDNCIEISGASANNISGLDLRLPLNRLVCLTGVSGSGKSTLMDSVIHQGFLAKRRKAAQNPAHIDRYEGDEALAETVLVDQSSVSRTPRSNPALFTDTWDLIRKLYATTPAAKSAGMTASHFSFNSGHGRCEHCQGLGYERIEMQFLADVYVTCPVCEGKRFKADVLNIHYNGKSVAELLDMDVVAALAFFDGHAAIRSRLSMLEAVGLGYLKLGQPLNTLSGGESQRLKLVRYLYQYSDNDKKCLILLDEPTTGLHRHDVKRLIAVLQQLVGAGHSLLVVEHQMDVIKSADWVIEMGPEAGKCGGKLVFEGTPEALSRRKTHTAIFLKAELRARSVAIPEATAIHNGAHHEGNSALRIVGAREHNLRNLNVEIPHGKFSVVTGVSGSGKSSLAFDIIFAEGQRRFMESMSAYARQFVEQLPRPELDTMESVAPTVAIEQRVTRGSRKSTVATVTEVAQYLRLLYAKVGVQHSPESGQPVASMSFDALVKRLEFLVSEQPKKVSIYLCAPLVRARKGHHQPLADWAAAHDIAFLRCDEKLIHTENFVKLDRYREHDIEACFEVSPKFDTANRRALLKRCLELGKGSCFLLSARQGNLGWLSTERADPLTGEAFPELDPKHFSWNSPKGWCATCRGYGQLFEWMLEHENFAHLHGSFEDGDVCPECEGARLNRVSRAVMLPLNATARKLTDADGLSLPGLLRLDAAMMMRCLRHLKLDKRGRAVAKEIVPEVEERLRFLSRVGLDYLAMDRSSSTLSGGEAQRIRLAAQLGSNLTGVLYVLDEPSIGLHARDNEALIGSLQQLREKGNTLLVVEHDDETMRAADHIIDLGPGAGIHGGELVAQGTYQEIITRNGSLTARYLNDGITHPLRGQYRDLPKAWTPRGRAKEPRWLVLREPCLRNLKGGELHLPLGRLTVVCGVSGAGKSTLIRDVLKPAVQQAIQTKTAKAVGEDFSQLVNGTAFHGVIEVDQEPIGKTPRSTPATYIGAFDVIRNLFATLPEARMRGWGAGHFSFNTKGGRCETCKGAGRVKLEMQFLPDSYLPCEDCGGRRYGAELEDLKWNGKSIGEVLKMSCEEAAGFFDFHSQLSGVFSLMVETGLG